MSPESSAPGPQGLTCYTANLAVYLGRCIDDAPGKIARSIRLAVHIEPNGGTPAFSHHCQALDRIHGEDRLVYQGAIALYDALTRIEIEIQQFGQCLAVANTAYLPWSSAGPEVQAPHFLLVDGRRRGEWHITDEFAALLPSGGEQRPFSGWVRENHLARCLTPIEPLPAEHRLRNEHAFGFPRPLPADGHYQWLARSGGDGSTHGDRLEAGWIQDTDSSLEYLCQFWSEIDRWPMRARSLDDVWATAQHHVFRCDWELARTHGSPQKQTIEEARAAWRELPLALRFAVDSERRGRSRPELIARTFSRLRQLEEAAVNAAREGA